MIRKLIALKNLKNLYNYQLANQQIDFDDIHILHACKWLLTSQKVWLNKGYSHSYHLFYEWQEPYPETTGYIIPTLLKAYQRYGIQEFYTSVKIATMWLKKIQNDDGSFNDLQRNTQVFDTGQILIGFNYLYEFFPEFEIEQYLIQCATWLCQVQNDDGSFQKCAYNNIPHTYYSRVGAALIQAGNLLNNQDFVRCGQKNITWTINQQRENGFFKYASFHFTPPYLHTIIYTLEGLLEAYKILKHNNILDSILLCSDKLLEISGSRDLILFSQYHEDYEPANREKCLTGIAQWAGVCFDIFVITNNEKYYHEALKNIYYLKSKQIFSSDQNLNGGLPGSLPINGQYLKFAIPNWGVKFFIDTLLKRKETAAIEDSIDEEKNYIADAFNCQGLFNANETLIEINRTYLNHLQKIIDHFAPDSKKILDLGAGGGEMVRLLQTVYPTMQIAGIDPVYSSEIISMGDFYNIPAESSSIDIIICKEVLQHSGNISTALTEIKRVLKNNGILIIIERNPISFLGVRKKLYEKIGKWMYPPDSPFQEKWYFSWEWKQLLTHFGKIIYLEKQNNKHGRKIFMNRDNRYFVIGAKNDK